MFLETKVSDIEHDAEMNKTNYFIPADVENNKKEDEQQQRKKNQDNGV